MKVQSFEDFSGGLDTRKPHNINNKDTLRRLVNAYVTSGESIRRRPGLRYLGEIEAGGNAENGLGSYNGSLHTFSTVDGAPLMNHVGCCPAGRGGPALAPDALFVACPGQLHQPTPYQRQSASGAALLRPARYLFRSL